MTKEEALSELARIAIVEAGDPECAHESADQVVLQYLATNGNADIVEAWGKVDDACKGFWYA